MSRFRVVFYGEGEKGSAGWRACFPHGTVVVGVKTTAFSWGQRGILNPEFEFTVGANRGNEVGVDGWGEPL